MAVIVIAACGATSDGTAHGAQSRSQHASHIATVPATPTAPVADTAASVPASALPYTGHDAHGVPHYVRRAFTEYERTLLRQVYGVEDPNRLYVSDSTGTGLLKYDTQLKRCATCYVNSYRVGFVSIRRPGESWDQLERRVRRMVPSGFPRSAHVATVSLAALDPDIQPDVAHMLADARTAGFRAHVLSTYRSPEREAYLMAIGGKRTHTLTSLHSYGRAVDISIGDGNPSHSRTRATWIRFRKWVRNYRGGKFHLIGTAAHTWDWNHVEIPSERVGFRSIDVAIARARPCGDPAATRQTTRSAHRVAYSMCNFKPHLARSQQP